MRRKGENTMRITLEIPDEIFKRYEQYYTPT
jgi:hypothetical protein